MSLFFGVLGATGEKMLLNIIHPYAFKQVNETLMIGPYEPYKERDERVSSFVQNALDSGTKVLVHKYSDGDFISDALRESALLSDPTYKCLYDERNEVITTTSLGVPLPDRKPEEISDEFWRGLREVYTTHSDLAEKVAGHSSVLFIGGILENCLANAADYFGRHFRKDGGEIFYLPELCVSLDEKELAEVKPKLDERDIQPLGYEEALNLISREGRAVVSQSF